MNREEQYQSWLNARRGESLPPELANRIMSVVCESAARSATSLRTDSSHSAWQRAIPYLICSAAAMVLAVRLYSAVSVFVVAPSESEIVMNELLGEPSNVSNP